VRRCAELTDVGFADGHKPTEQEIRARIEASANGTGERVLGEIYVHVTLGDNSTIVLRDLAPGAYLLTVELLGILAESPIDLRAGEHAAMALRLGDLPEPRAKVPLSGTLYVPPAWGKRDFTLKLGFCSIDDLEFVLAKDIELHSTTMQEVPGAPSWLRWMAGDVAPGDYLAQIDDGELWLLESIEAPPSGRDDVRLMVKEPADVRVHIVDAETREPCQVTCVEVSDISRRRQAIWNPATMSYGMRLTAERTTIEVRHRDRWFEQTIDLLPGVNEIAFELPRPCGVVMWCHDGNTRIAWPRSSMYWEIGLRNLAAPGERATCAYEDSGLAIHVTAAKPGRYQVLIPPLQGFLDVPPQEIEIPPGQFVELEVRVTRRP
jgi:hypothetical protein